MRRPCAVMVLAALPGWAACPDDREFMLDAVNRVRAEGASCGSRGSFPPAPAVVWNDQLAAMALSHAEWLVSIDELRHLGPQGQSLGERARQAGYRFARVGENLAQGQRTLDAALQSWTASETHCATLFGSTYTQAAIVCLRARDGRPLWVMEIGRPQLPWR